MDVFQIVYTCCGGLGLFFMGMKMMSDALQQSAGDMIKSVITSITDNRFLAVLVGIVVTAVIQSSSVTTVMVIGFINAGLMTLFQGISVILGANIGTTLTGWIISINIGKYGLLLIGLGVIPALFAKNAKWKNIGTVFLGIGMIFFGMQIMSGAFRPLRDMPEFVNALKYFSKPCYSSWIPAVLVGAVLTALIQASAAMFGIVLSMAVTGLINYDTAVALVLGTNIGTTITAVLACVGGNINTKRAALAHALFNIIGVVVIMAIFPYFLDLVQNLIPGDATYINEKGEAPYVGVHLATAHTMFNIIATLIFLPFVNQLAALVTKLAPDKALKEHHHLVLLGNPKEILPATALIQASSEINHMADVLGRMFKITREYIADDSNNGKTLAKIKDYEHITDNMQKEITIYMCKVLERPLTASQSVDAQSIVRIADELESVGDYLDRLATYKTRFCYEQKLNEESLQNLLKLFDKVEDFFHSIEKGVVEHSSFDITVSTRKVEELRLLCDSAMDAYISMVSKGEFTPLSSMTYSDMVSSLKKIRSHVYNVSQAIARY